MAVKFSALEAGSHFTTQKNYYSAAGTHCWYSFLLKAE
jgi:hypothetical protein